MPVARMLNKGIVTSEKINSLSWPAQLLFTWSIMFEDSAGYLEASPTFLKGTVFPIRDDLSVNDLIPWIIEIIISGAWIPFRAKDNHKLWVWDPKFEDHQKNRPKIREAPSKFSTRDEKGNNLEFHIGLERIPLDKIEEYYDLSMCSKMESVSFGENSVPKKSNVIESNVSKKSQASPLSLKSFMDEDPEAKALVEKLRQGKFPKVGVFLGKAIKELKDKAFPDYLREDLKQTLQAIEQKESFDGDVYAYAMKAFEQIVSENTSKRVEAQAEEYKKDEAKGPEVLKSIFERIEQ